MEKTVEELDLTPYDALEIHGCSVSEGGVDMDDDNPEFYCVYGHYKQDGDNSGLEDLQDCLTPENAVNAANALAIKAGGLTVTSYI